MGPITPQGKALAWAKEHWKELALGAALLMLLGAGWMNRETRKELALEQKASQEASSLASENEMKYLSEQEKVQVLETRSTELKQKLKEAGSRRSTEAPLLVDGKPFLLPNGKAQTLRSTDTDWMKEGETQAVAVYEMRYQRETEAHQETQRQLTLAQESRNEAWALLKQVETSKPSHKRWGGGVDYLAPAGSWIVGPRYWLDFVLLELGIKAGTVVWGPGTLAPLTERPSLLGVDAKF